MWSSPAAVQPLDPLHVQQIAVGDHAGNGAGLPHAADNVVQLGMRQRLAAGDADHGRPQPSQVVDAPVHLFQRHRLGDLVVLVAVGAAQVAEAHGDNLRQHRMRSGSQRARHHRVLARLAPGRNQPPAHRRSPGNPHLFY